MTIYPNPANMTIVNGAAPPGARVLPITEYDLSIAALMDKIHFWGASWMLPYDGSPLTQRVWSGGQERVATASKAAVTNTGLIGSRRAWSFPLDTNAKINVPDATVPLTHTIYAAVQCATDSTVGLFGNTDGTGARLLLRMDAGGSLRYDHSGASAADILTASAKWTAGAQAILWASYDQVTKGVKMGGTQAGVVELAASSTKTFVNNHKGGSGYSIGNLYGFFAAHRIGDIIIAGSDLPTTDVATHTAIVTALAAKYGLTVA